MEISGVIEAPASLFLYENRPVELVLLKSLANDSFDFGGIDAGSDANQEAYKIDVKLISPNGPNHCA